MVFQYILVPGAGVYVRIDFGGEDGLVAQHFLDDAQVGTVFYQMGGEGVAEGVGRDFLLDAGGHGLVFNQLEKRNAAEGDTYYFTLADGSIGQVKKSTSHVETFINNGKYGIGNRDSIIIAAKEQAKKAVDLGLSVLLARLTD